MVRLLICLSLCLLFAPDQPEVAPSERPATSGTALLEPLPEKDIVTFLQNCLDHLDGQKIDGYSLMMKKQERIGGKLQASEEVEVHFRGQPHSVLMKWQKGQRRADSALYVEGENDGKLLVHPSGVAGALVKFVSRDPEGDDAKQAGRYSMKEFGLKKTAERTIAAWKKAKGDGRLTVEYQGVKKVREAGDRLCYALKRTCLSPEEDGLMEVTVYIDKETLLQVGTVLKDGEGKLIGEYMFRDIRINPKFKPEQFKRSALTT